MLSSLRPLPHRAVPLSAALAAVAFTLAGSAAAQAPRLEHDSSEATGKALQRTFDKAVSAQERGDFATACPLFAQVVEALPEKLGAKLALAGCYEGAGKLASAAAAYRAASALATKLRDGRGKLATDKSTELEVKAARLTVEVPDGVRALPGLVVTRDGRVVEASQLAHPLLADPGEVMVAASAPGKKPWSAKVTVTADGARVALPMLEDLAPEGGPTLPLVRAVEVEAPVEPAPARPWWPFLAGGAGLVSAGLAVGFGVDQMAAQKDFDASCKTLPRNGPACDGTSARLYRDFGLWIGLGAAGLGGIVAGTVGLVTRPGPRAAAPASASFTVVPMGTGAALVGRF